MDFFKKKLPGHLIPVLWGVSGVLLLAMLFARAVWPEVLWLTVAVSVLLIAALALLARENWAAFRGRAAAFGFYTVVTTVIIIGIVGVLNFLIEQHPLKWDITKNKRHTLSEQTVKIIKELKKPVKAVLFAKMGQREATRPLLENLKGLSTKFEVEFVDPDKEPTRAKQVGIKKYNTLQLIAGAREAKIEDADEEKITNSLIKLLKEREQVLCAISDHGEKKFSSTEPDGYDTAKKALANQAYEIKEISLLQENKVPDTCDVLAILGPQKSFFEPEIKAIKAYLDNGGRALITLETNVKGNELAPELLGVLGDWYVRPVNALIVDPLSRMLGVDAAVPILATFSKDNPITKDFSTNCYFPFSRPLEVMSGAPTGLTIQWLAQTTPKSWGETDFHELATGQVKFDAGKDKQGPLNVAMAVNGKQKDSKAPRNTRIVVFGSSQFAGNNYSRFGGNMDLFLNSISWLMEDESLISIRAKDEGPGKVELSQKQGAFIFLLTVILIPLLIAAGGIVIWVLRKRL